MKFSFKFSGRRPRCCLDSEKGWRYPQWQIYLKKIKIKCDIYYSLDNKESTPEHKKYLKEISKQRGKNNMFDSHN